MDFPIGTRLVYQVDGLVGQESLVDVFGTGAHRKVERLVGIVDPVKLLVVLFQLFQDLQRLFRRWLGDVYLLEASHQSLRTGKVAVVFLVGGRADEPDISALEIGLQHIRGIHRAFASGTGPHKVMDLVDVDDVVIGLLGDALHHFLDALLKVAAELGSRQQCAQVELIYLAALQSLRQVVAIAVDVGGQSVDQSRLAHTRLSDVQRVVLLLAAEHLDGALQFLLPSDERVVVLVGVVQAGHHLPPAFLAVVCFLVLILILVIEAGQVVVVGIAGHQFAEEVLLPIAEQVRQQIGSIRLLQVEDALHDVRHVDEVGTRVLYDSVGCCQGLAQLL